MPETNPLLTPESSVLVLIDYQPEMLSFVRSMEPAVLELNVCAVARAAKALGVPTVLSTVGVEMGVNRPTIPSLAAEIPDAVELDRSSMNAWEDDAFRAAVERTGRRRVVFGALWTEICLAFPVVQAQREGFETYFVADAVGGTSAAAHEAAVQRMIQAGSVPLTAIALLAEWVRDWKSSRADAAREVMRWYYPALGRLAEREAPSAGAGRRPVGGKARLRSARSWRPGAANSSPEGF